MGDPDRDDAYDWRDHPMPPTIAPDHLQYQYGRKLPQMWEYDGHLYHRSSDAWRDYWSDVESKMEAK